MAKDSDAKELGKKHGKKPSGTQGQHHKGQKDPHAVSLGAKGGKKGGPARADSLSPQERSEIAHEGAVAKNRAMGRRAVNAPYTRTSAYRKKHRTK